MKFSSCCDIEVVITVVAFIFTAIFVLALWVF